MKGLPREAGPWYSIGMAVRRSSHAVFDTKYHLVWTPKYRKAILVGRPKERLRQIFLMIAEEFGFIIEEMELMPDQAHLFLSFPPKYAIAEVVRILKSLSARQMFEEFAWLRRHLWGGELWNDGYFVRTVGDKVTAEIIKRYIRYQKSEGHGPKQLRFFK